VTQTRAGLPRLVDQVRILMWFQMHLSLIGVLVVILAAVWVDKTDQGFNYQVIDEASRIEQRLFQAMVLLVGIAVVLAICAKLLWRGWKWVYLLALVAQAGAVAVVIEGFLVGVGGALLVLLYAGLTGWILVDLFRGEVLRYVWRR
jgi:hypothetical protein